MSTGETVFRQNSIVVTDEDGRNLRIHKAHTPSDTIKIEWADRWDLLVALMRAQGVDPDVIAIVDPRSPR